VDHQPRAVGRPQEVPGDLKPRLDEQLVRRALADSWWQLLALHGALGSGWRAELLSYEAPTYFGMACVLYTPSPGDDAAE